MLAELSRTSVVVGPLSLPRPKAHVRFGSPNPGLGGSHFTAIQLALALERSRKFKSVSLWVPLHGVDLGGAEICQIKSSDEIPAEQHTVLIASCSELLKLSNSLPPAVKIIAVSHHPHDESIRKATKEHRIQVVVSVGQYAYWSNRAWSPRHHVMLRDLISPQEIAANKNLELRPNLENFVVGHISSLHPSKGFEAISKAWPAIHEEFPEARLEVVGGRSLYGDAENHPLLPMDWAQGEAVLHNLGESASSVRFLGRLEMGVDDVMANWSLGILNPSGESEADPASFKDMARAGVPALAGYDFGLADFLHDFPHLRLRNKKQVARRAISLLHDPETLIAISHNLTLLARRLIDQNNQIEEGWLRLLNAVASFGEEVTHGDKRPGRAPIQPLPFHLRIWLRNLRLQGIRIVRRVTALLGSSSDRDDVLVSKK